MQIDEKIGPEALTQSLEEEHTPAEPPGDAAAEPPQDAGRLILAARDLRMNVIV